MALLSHLAKGSSSEDDPGAETLIAHDQDHGIYTLGPICTERPLFPHIIESFIIPDGFQLPITEDWFSISLHPKELHGWPKPNDDYLDWLDRVANQWGREWKTWGIYDIIMLSKKNFSPNIDMFFSFLGFWNTAINAFVFLFRIMSPSLFDVAARLGLPIVGEDIPTLYDEDFEDLDCLVSKENAAYGKYLKEHK